MITSLHSIGIVLAFWLVAAILGSRTLDWSTRLIASREANPNEAASDISIATLVGFGLIACLGVAAGLAHIFYWWTFVAFAVALVAAETPRLLRLASRRAGVRARSRRDPLLIVLLTGLGLEALGTWITALSPPVAFDELAYHLPEAQFVATTHFLPLNLGNHWFYGNIPKLIEVLYAQGLVVGTFVVPHLLHAAIYTTCLRVIYVFVRDAYSARTGALAALLVGLLPELAANASSGYIDAATASFETAGLLAAITWIVGRSPRALVASALLEGFAVSSKYSSLTTVILIGLALAIVAMRNPSARRVTMSAAGLTVVVAGYWYLKNLIRFGNPAYPLYFGHRGVSDEKYRGLIAALQQFGPRTLGAFLRVPHLFGGVLQIPAFLSFYLAPLSLFQARSRRFTVLLLLFFAVYVPYWFFIASQQTRFLFPALIVSSILLAITLTTGVRGILIAAAVGAMAFLAIFPRSTLTPPASAAIVKSRLGVSNIRVALGLESRDAFLKSRFGCQYSILAYVYSHHLHGQIADDWSEWFANNLATYDPDHLLVRLPKPATARSLKSIKYLYIHQTDYEQFPTTKDPIIHRYWAGLHPIEVRLLAHARLLVTIDDCRLWALQASPAETG